MPMVIHTKIKSKWPKIEMKIDETYLKMLNEGERVERKIKYILTHGIVTQLFVPLMFFKSVCIKISTMKS
jgi:hypothetical protein